MTKEEKTAIEKDVDTIINAIHEKECGCDSLRWMRRAVCVLSDMVTGTLSVRAGRKRLRTLAAEVFEHDVQESGTTS
jgi:hypothetical protein